jgi:hypothetical protein
VSQLLGASAVAVDVVVARQGRETRRAGSLREPSPAPTPGRWDRLSSRRRDVVAAAGVALLTAVAALIIMLPAPLPGHVVSATDTVSTITPFTSTPPMDLRHQRNPLLTDSAQVFRPDGYWARGQVRAGHLPLWSPLTYGGWPLLASQQDAPLFPVTALGYVLPYAESMAWRIIALLVLAAVGVFAFGRAIGLGRCAAALAGVAYGLSGPLVLWSLHPHDDVHAMLGWMMLGAFGAARGRRWGVPVLAAAVGLGALGGHPESMFTNGMLLLAWGVAAVATAPAGRRLRGAGALVAGAVLGLLAGAVMILPLAEMLGQSGVGERGGFVGPDVAGTMSLALPDVWGRPDWAFSTDAGPLVNYVQRTAFVGIAPLVLAAVGLAVRRDRLRWFFVAVAAGSVVLAYDVPGLSSWIVALWPLRLVSMSYAVTPLVFSVAILGGLGLQAVMDRPDALRQGRVAWAVLAVVALPVAWALTRFHLDGIDGALGWLPGVANPTRSEQAVAASITRWLVAATIALGFLWWLRRGGGRTAAAAAVVACALLLGLAWHGYVPVLTTRAATLPRTPSIQVLQARQGSGRSVAGAPVGAPQPIFPNTGEYFGLRDPRGRGVPSLARPAAVWAALGGEAGPTHSLVSPSDPTTARLLRVFGVRTALVFPNQPAPPDSTLVHRGIDGDVYALHGTLPRAFVTCGWRPSSEAAATRALRTASVASLRDRPFVEGVAPSGRPCATAAVAARVVHDGSTDVTLEARSAQGGRLVLLDNWYPGWEATVDGHPVSIAPTDVAFRSVPVPAGVHRVVFRYRPTSVRDGIVVSVVAWLAIAALAAFAVVRGRHARRA